MNLREEHPPRSRLRVVPPVSSRTLQHPSLLPLYLAAGLARHHGGWDNPTGESTSVRQLHAAAQHLSHSGVSSPVHAITPDEFYYTDPTGSCGTRIPNMLTDFGFYDCFQLNTPPPLMSSCVNPSNRPDPFSLGPHPTRELGRLDWNMNPIRLPVKTSQAIIQLTPEEDQAVTHLLKLRYQEFGPDDETPTKEVYQPSSRDGKHQSQEDLGNKPQAGIHWSETELEAAETLLNFYSWTKQSGLSASRNHPPHQDMDLALGTET
ncbi:uncharacterized protein LOC133950291 [Platichthys flesus]|uniref:uncharacterized protein LOC133950291 n=1 Tax=Platichthys flesus TaxID=8260 RepID=UPI002DBAD2B8|nr:uncharacterized protein LOC133950291 [Platichthys flesus]